MGELKCKNCSIRLQDHNNTEYLWMLWAFLIVFYKITGNSKQNQCIYVTDPLRWMLVGDCHADWIRWTKPHLHLSDKWLGPNSLALPFYVVACLWCHQIIAPFRTRKGPLSAHGMEEYPWWQSLLFHTANNCLLCPGWGKCFWVETVHIWDWGERESEREREI